MKTFFKQYFWLIVMIGLAVVVIGVFSIQSSCDQKKLDSDVSNRQNEADRAVQESQNESGVAANYSIERRAEDAVREKVILPKLDEARRRSTNSNSQVQTAQKEYENAKTNLENLNRSISDNCAELQRLYPNVHFEYCSKR